MKVSLSFERFSDYVFNSENVLTNFDAMTLFNHVRNIKTVLEINIEDNTDESTWYSPVMELLKDVPGYELEHNSNGRVMINATEALVNKALRPAF